jgi:hypothetical protein
MKRHSRAFRALPLLFFTALLCLMALFPSSEAQQNKSVIDKLCFGVHVRKDISTLSAQEIASLRHGIQVMMSRPSSDPTSWIFQANMHGTYDASDTQPLWNGCKHGSNEFLAWHRMYLYYFERILRAASGDPFLTLPYWNYTSVSERAIPLPYRQPADASNVLFVGDRNPTLNAGGTLPDSATSYLIAFSDLNFDATFGTSFGGTIILNPGQFEGGGGQFEAQPHNVIHNTQGGLMADPNTAAQDPVFWLHHSNIDRLWKRWLDQGGGRQNPTSETGWMNTTYQFYDENRNLASLSGKDILNTVTQLNYRYDDDPPEWILSYPLVHGAVIATQFPTTPAEQLAVTSPVKVELGAEPATLELKLSPGSDAKISRLLNDREMAHAVILELQGVDFGGNSGFYYEVYVNLPRVWPEPPNFHCPFWIGNLAVFVPRKAAHAVHKSTNVSLDLTRLIRYLKDQKAWTPNQLTVTFVLQQPIPPEGQKPPETKLGVRATIDKITILAK